MIQYKIIELSDGCVVRKRVTENALFGVLLFSSVKDTFISSNLSEYKSHGDALYYCKVKTREEAEDILKRFKQTEQDKRKLHEV